MKRIYLIASILFFSGVALGQVQLQCPPCLPVTGCDLCWESVQQAQNSGCTSASRASDLINGLDSDINMSIYPNPSYNGEFTLESTDGLNGEFIIIDPLGRVLTTFQLHGETIYKLKNKIPQGLYFLLYKSKDGLLFERKLLSE